MTCVICVKKFAPMELFFSHCPAVNPPSAIISPTLLWAKSDEVRGSGSNLTLTCQAQDYHPSLPITWKVVGFPYSNGDPPIGLNLQITWEVAYSVSPLADEFPELRLVGDFYCEMWGYIPEQRVVSAKAVVKLYGKQLYDR